MCYFLEEFEGNIQEEAVFCHKNFHPLHIVCRFRWAEQKKHTCPVCRESFEEDDGEMFCRVYGLSKPKKNSNSGSNNESKSSSSHVTPISPSNVNRELSNRCKSK